MRYLAVTAALILVSCGTLPRNLRDEIASEHDKLQQADRQVQRTPDDAKALSELAQAKADSAELDKIVHDSGKIGVAEARRRAESLRRDERSLRQAALRDSEAFEAAAIRKRDFEKNAPQNLAKMKSEYERVHSFDLTPVTQVIQKAALDWPAKKSDLEARLAALHHLSDDASTEWQTAESTPVSADTVPALIAADDALARDESGISAGAEQLKALSGQLYVSWDKILVDLEQDPVYREKVKTITTKNKEVNTDEAWVDISAPTYRSLQNDLGMSIAHKDAGYYDSEAVTMAQPPGYAYIATPEQGRNQYGYWHSGIWTWLPEYLIMRELFWGHNYQPIYINEYHGYQTAVRSGRTYYGQESPSAPPKYGTHGTFTEQRYAGSRYMQSGGYRSSGYASSRGAEAPRPSSGFSPAPESSAGKRFGGGSSPSGHQFGHAPASRPSGHSFGGRRH